LIVRFIGSGRHWKHGGLVLGKEGLVLGKEGLVLGKEGLVLGKEGLVLGKEGLGLLPNTNIQGWSLSTAYL